jgi:sugar phosphate isomerase/epimerase
MAVTRPLRIGVSTYSFWHFKGEPVDIAHCIDRAAEMGFDGVEILHQQMGGEDNGYLQDLKRRAFTQGLDIMGFSTHQGFVSPDKAVRRRTSTTRSNASTSPGGWASRPCA